MKSQAQNPTNKRTALPSASAAPMKQTKTNADSNMSVGDIPTSTTERPPLQSFFEGTESPIQKDDIETPDEDVIKAVRGKKGDKGDRGEVGQRGPRGYVGVAGIDGKDGKDGKEGARGEKGEKGDQGDRGFPGEEGQAGRDGIDGKDGKIVSPETPKSIVEKINKGRSKISRSKVEGLEDVENVAKSTEKRLQNYISIGGARQTRVASSGTVIATGADTINFIGATVATPAGNNGSTVDVTITGSGFQGSTEASTTTPNGSQQTFAFTHTPTMIFWNGSFQMPNVDYTITGNDITFSGTNTPQTGDTVANVYA